MDRVKCFFLEPTGLTRFYLRRFCWSDKSKCPGKFGYHNAMDHFEDLAQRPEQPENDDPRWPFKCDHCDYHFGEEDQHQIFESELMARTDTKEVMTTREAPGGALWYADWYLEHKVMWQPGSDGHFLMCKLPNGIEWMVDGRANNCTRKDDNVHKCWIRNGTPPEVTVGKEGDTCAAGAGSILAGDYHGFLRNGWLERC